MPTYVPNVLTLFRILLIPAFIFSYFQLSPADQKLLPMGIFVLATATDVLDGFIARRYQLITKLGTVLDPLADKLMLLTALACLVIDRRIPLFILVLVLLKECFMIAAAAYLYFSKHKAVIPANKVGKLATILFFAAVVSALSGWHTTVQMGLMLGALAVAFAALTSYIKTYKAGKTQ